MNRRIHWDWFMGGLVLTVVAFWCGGAIQDWSHSRAIRPQVTRTHASAPVYVSIYVYNAADVEKVLTAARKVLPGLEGTEGTEGIKP